MEEDMLKQNWAKVSYPSCVIFRKTYWGGKEYISTDKYTGIHENRELFFKEFDVEYYYETVSEFYESQIPNCHVFHKDSTNKKYGIKISPREYYVNSHIEVYKTRDDRDIMLLSPIYLDHLNELENIMKKYGFQKYKYRLYSHNSNTYFKIFRNHCSHKTNKRRRSLFTFI